MIIEKSENLYYIDHKSIMSPNEYEELIIWLNRNKVKFSYKSGGIMQIFEISPEIKTAFHLKWLIYV